MNCFGLPFLSSPLHFIIPHVESLWESCYFFLMKTLNSNRFYNIIQPFSVGQEIYQ